jgi:HK97 family phage portal protein
MDFPTGINNSTSGRAAWGSRTSYEVLRAMLRAHDTAQACVNHKIDEIRSMEPLFTPVEGAQGDTKLAVAAARAALAYPDREHSYDEWLSRWLINMLTFDSGPLYRRRNRNGQVIGLDIIDGATVFPYIDKHGRRPKAPAPAYFQIIQGQTYQEFTAEDIIYPVYRPQNDSPFGMAPLESVMMAVNTSMRLQWHFLQMFTEGSIPGGFMEAPPDLSSADQIAEWQDYWDATFSGDQAIIHKMVMVPSGSKFTGTAPATFDREFPKWLDLKICAAFGVVPQDIGITDDVNRATGETQTDTQFRVNTLPWVRFVESHLNRYVQHDLGLPVEVKLNTGRDKEDRLQEAQLWKIAVESGIASMDEAREELFGLPADPLRPVPRGIVTPRLGFVPLQSILAISGTVDPETKAPADDVPLSEATFDGTPGLMPDKLPGIDEFKRAPINPDEPSFPELERNHPETGTVVKPAPGVAKSVDDAQAKEMARFNAFRKRRAKAGTWRDFEFTTVHKSVADQLNAQARTELVKDEPFGGADASPKVGTPSWRDDPPVLAPQHAVDLTLTDYWAPQVQEALQNLWAAADLENAVTATQGIGDAGMQIFRDTARQVLSGAIQPSTLEQVLTNAWADAYNVGAMAAKVQMGQIPTGWDAWKPGMTDANQITALGWKETLQEAGISLKGITDTTVNRLAYRIADGVNAGDPSDVIGGALDDILGDPLRSELIAHTETARMLTNAAMDQYALFGVKQWDLVTSAGACPTCQSLEDQNPHDVGDGKQPPVHPRCRCAASPHLEGQHS